ncbi:MAG: insulinase family protein [Cryomorphaceae bacterium]|jgi:predicted Zn-dependent peptidase|nr:insulinase family protein [Cryomorphaceae bacterium]
MKAYQPICEVLANGTRLVYLKVPSQVAHLGFFFAAGSRHEGPNQIGLAHFLEHCLFKGTQKRNALHILSRIDAVGGELNAYTAKEEMCLYASFSKEHTQRAIDLLSDISINSTFPEKEIEKEKEVILDEINSYLDSPSDKIFDDFDAKLFENHPLGQNILGTKESVSSFTQQDLQQYIQQYFTADNLVVSFVGNVPLARLKVALEAALSQMPLTAERSVPQPFTFTTPFKEVLKEANYQAHAVLGGLAPSYHDDERVAMSLLINILGGPALNSRLNLSVRERYGYAYSIEANYHTFADTGYWQIYFGSEPKNVNKTLTLIDKELDKLREKTLSASQLLQAKRQYKGHLALGMDVNSGLMQGLGKSMLAFGQIDTIAEMHQAIDKITSQEIQVLAQKHLRKEVFSSLIFDV